jgi:hypothetical protein
MFWLRLSFWVAAMADFPIAVMVLIPDLPGDDYVISKGQMSAVAFSWGVFLIMADRRPAERRWVAISLGICPADGGLPEDQESCSYIVNLEESPIFVSRYNNGKSHYYEIRRNSH